MLAIDAVLVGGVAVGLEGRNEGLEAGREDNEVAGTGRGDVGVGIAGGNEDCSAGAGRLGAVGVTEGQLAFKNVPGFVVGVVDVERGGAAAAPFVDGERVARGRERHSIIILVSTLREPFVDVEGKGVVLERLHQQLPFASNLWVVNSQLQRFWRFSADPILSLQIDEMSWVHKIINTNTSLSLSGPNPFNSFNPC